MGVIFYYIIIVIMLTIYCSMGTALSGYNTLIRAISNIEREFEII